MNTLAPLALGLWVTFSRAYLCPITCPSTTPQRRGNVHLHNARTGANRPTSRAVARPPRSFPAESVPMAAEEERRGRAYCTTDHVSERGSSDAPQRPNHLLTTSSSAIGERGKSDAYIVGCGVRRIGHRAQSVCASRQAEEGRFRVLSGPSSTSKKDHVFLKLWRLHIQRAHASYPSLACVPLYMLKYTRNLSNSIPASFDPSLLHLNSCAGSAHRPSALKFFHRPYRPAPIP